jgi:transporter family-2 protein
MALLAGTAIALQTGVNSQLRVWLGNPMQSALVSFAVGTIALALYVLPQRQSWTFTGEGNRPWWIWTGGLLGAYVVTALILLAPRLGASLLIALVVAGQMITALVLDHFGLLGFPQQRISLLRLLGGALLIVGVILIRKY